MSKKIQLYGKVGEGKFAIVDDEDYELVSKYKWYLNKRGYVSTLSKDKTTRVYLHRLVMGLSDFCGIMVDHKHGNRLDNRKSQLRKCNNSQNQANTLSWRGLGTKGITLNGNKWVVRIMVNGERKYLGRFENQEEAEKVYADASRYFFGEFAYQS